jgi:hypothetical protein
MCGDDDDLNKSHELGTPFERRKHADRSGRQASMEVQSPHSLIHAFY